MFDIDYVFPYVNNQEPVWMEGFKNFCLQHGCTERYKDINNERYCDLGFLPLVIKSIKKNLPFIRKIHVIVSNLEQAPDWLYNDSVVNIVLHKDIIPSKYLPTYNSTTIEMYLRRIPDLAEHFIYANDDMFILNEMKPEDFFTEDGHIKIKFIDKDLTCGQFAQVCYNNYAHVLDTLGCPHLEDKFERPEHSITPMIKSHCNECIEMMGSKIFTSAIDPFRNNKQHNQYIYPLWEKYKYGIDKSKVKFGYVCMKDSLETICSTISNKKIDVLCFNDCPSNIRPIIVANIDKVKQCFRDRISYGRC